MSLYQMVVLAPDADAAVGLLVSGSAGAPWGIAIPGAVAEGMAESLLHVVVSVPDTSRGALEQAFPGSPWMALASGIDALVGWREAMVAQ